MNDPQRPADPSATVAAVDAEALEREAEGAIATASTREQLDDEPIGVELVLGGALVLAGVYVGALRRYPVES